MKLRYYANIRLPTEKAHGIQIMSMCRAFAAAGASVELVIPDRYNPLREDPFAYYGIAPNFTIRRLRTFDLTRFGRILRSPVHIFQQQSFARAALRDAKKNPADIYYHRDEEAFRTFAEAGLASVWELHDIPEHFPRYLPAAKEAKKIITITRGLADQLSAAGISPENILAAPDGVNLEEFENLPGRETARKTLGLPQEKTIVLYAGQLLPWKGVETLIRAAAGLPPNIEVVICGGNQTEINRLKTLASASGAQCRFIGWIKHNCIPLYLAAADIAVIPNSAKAEISERYTSPLKLFEAMAAGKAITASDLPSLREVLNKTTAALVPPDSPEALKEAIRDLAADPDQRTRLGAAAHAAAPQYSWGERAKKILAALASA